MTELVDHLIEAKNLVLGNSRFLTLRLPETWDLAPGVSRPEVAASHMRSEIRWVAHGDFWYIVYQRELGWAMEINGRMRPTLRRGDNHQGETVSAGGHPAMLDWKLRRRGPPWRRHDVVYMTVAFECVPSDRAIELEFSGWCPEEGFKEILRTLPHLECH
jgi:hypothetical protein